MVAPSLAGRIALAVLLYVGYHLLAVAMMAGLLLVPFVEWEVTHHVVWRLVVFCTAGAFLIGRAMVPTRDRFRAPGPRLDPAEQPRLFAEVTAVARATDQAMPADVYLVADVNAWVAERGGRRVLALGLPLLQVLTTAQLRAVLAHEFGHFHDGDTALGPWIYRTRAAIGRTLERLGRHGTLLTRPFEWYGALFVRVTHAVGRRQELAADALAARVAGARALAEGLARIHATASALQPYWTHEVVPALATGLRPPLVEGFARFLAAAPVAAGVRAALTHELEGSTTDPRDTHPSLRERLAALGVAADALASAHTDADASSAEELPATMLLAQLDRLEERLVRALGPADAPPLARLAWEAAGAQVWEPRWRRTVAAHRAALVGLTAPALADYADADAGPLAARLGLAARPDAATDAARADALAVVGAALAVALLDAGWTLRALPGEEVACTRGEVVLLPFRTPHDLATGRLTPADWRTRCIATGIESLALALASDAQPEVPA
jgi:heat shock protein HtpX